MQFESSSNKYTFQTLETLKTYKSAFLDLLPKEGSVIESQSFGSADLSSEAKLLANLINSKEILPWKHPDSLLRLRRANIGPQFFALSNHFESEINKFYCAVCSAVIVLNALRAEHPTISKPCDPNFYPGSRDHLPEGLNPVFCRYTQSTFLNVATDSIKCREAVLGRKNVDCGLQLNELARILEFYGLNCSVTLAEDNCLTETLKINLIQSLQKSGSYVIINYSRLPLGQGRGSHMSPIASYDEQSDSFLVLDVNPNVAPWAWISAELLCRGMRTFDTVANRGFLVVEEGML